MKDFGDIAVKLSRNPLGVLSLALVLVDAIAAVVSTSSVLESPQRTILVWFMVLFPVLILALFYCLVAFHSRKLYAPSDFASDSNFLIYTGQLDFEKEGTKEALQSTRSAIEYKILNTLWTKQVNLSPDYTRAWTFRLDANEPEVVDFRIASSRLIGEGLLTESNDKQVYLTQRGYSYWKEHHQEFPADQWFSKEPINKEKLKIALRPVA